MEFVLLSVKTHPIIILNDSKETAIPSLFDDCVTASVINVINIISKT